MIWTHCTKMIGNISVDVSNVRECMFIKLAYLKDTVSAMENVSKKDATEVVAS